MSKHNKKRNTAFIYEVLLREVIKHSIAQEKPQRDVAISLLKEAFKKGTHLRAELDLYNALSQTQDLTEKTAEKLIHETLKCHLKIDRQKLFAEQSQAISDINKRLSKNVFSNFVPNYTDLATIGQLFSDNLNPKSKVLLENKLAQHLMEKSANGRTKRPITGLVVKKFVKRFNDTYEELLEEQKQILSKYISSAQEDNLEFNFYLNEEIARLKGVIKKGAVLEEVLQDTMLQEKLKKVASYLEEFNQQPLDRDHITQVLKIQGLAKEIQS
tara:strand:+ start:511 stop:1323 length:813 start_codon:yes stop_codon:yes gene_type:complete